VAAPDDFLNAEPFRAKRADKRKSTGRSVLAKRSPRARKGRLLQKGETLFRPLAAL
jgi:hypothetical protein